MTRWVSLPQEIRGMILGYVATHDRIAPYAPVSLEWRDAMEKKTFRHLRIQASSSDYHDRTPMVFQSLSRLRDRHRRLVKHIWLNVEHIARNGLWDGNINLPAVNLAIRVAITRLFQALEFWPAQSDLTLEINVYEPMYYSEEWFKGHHIGGPGEQDEYMCLSSTPQPTELVMPPHDALWRLFSHLGFDMQDAPFVQVVTKFLLTRQCRRQFTADTLSCIFERLPRLEEIVLETWDVSEIHGSDNTDIFARYLFIQPDSFKNVKSMTVFQDRNEYFNTVSRRHKAESRRHFQQGTGTPPDTVSWRQPVLARELAVASLSLENLSVSFMIDAVDFFGQCRVNWLWSELRSLTLTSRLLTCNGDSFKINGLLLTAAQMARRIPKLERLTIWNGGVNEACAFTYRKHGHNASVTWQAKGDAQLHPAVYSAWESVAEHSRCFFKVENKGTWPIIMSHAAAIMCLGLEYVVGDVSLRQMQLENSIPY